MKFQLVLLWGILFVLTISQGFSAAAIKPSTQRNIREKIVGFDDPEYKKLSAKRLAILRDIEGCKDQLLKFAEAIKKNPHVEGIARSKIETLIQSLKGDETRLKEVEANLTEKRKALKPDLYRRKKEVSLQTLEYSSASEFSGALEWAHRKGIIGEHTSILVLEDNGEFVHSDLRGQLEGRGGPYDRHAISVTGVVYEIAPGSRISVYSFNHFYLAHAPDNMIINNSTDITDPVGEKAKKIDEKLIARKNNLLIFSAGNGGQYLKGADERDPLDFLFNEVKPSPKNRIIIAGSLDPSSEASDFSNKPGPRPEFQERFLFTLGRDVLIRKKEMEYGTANGGSLAAPAISGVAALVLSVHRDFSMEEVATVLLESAERNFYISSTNKFVYDPTDGEEKAVAEANYDPKNLEHFNPMNYGRGILSVRRAFIWADIYEKLKKELPEATLEERLPETRKRFKEKIREEDYLHATNIQRAFRDWKVRGSPRGGNISR